jgi:hypothetical protein
MSDSIFHIIVEPYYHDGSGYSQASMEHGQNQWQASALRYNPQSHAIQAVGHPVQQRTSSTAAGPSMGYYDQVDVSRGGSSMTSYESSRVPIEAINTGHLAKHQYSHVEQPLSPSMAPFYHAHQQVHQQSQQQAQQMHTYPSSYAQYQPQVGSLDPSSTTLHHQLAPAMGGADVAVMGGLPPAEAHLHHGSSHVGLHSNANLASHMEGGLESSPMHYQPQYQLVSI